MGSRLTEHAAELAEYVAHPSDPADREKTVRYGEMAAQRAMAVDAYGEAVRHLGHALEVQEAQEAQEALDPDDKMQRRGLLLALGESLRAAEGDRCGPRW